MSVVRELGVQWEKVRDIDLGDAINHHPTEGCLCLIDLGEDSEELDEIEYEKTDEEGEFEGLNGRFHVAEYANGKFFINLVSYHCDASDDSIIVDAYMAHRFAVIEAPSLQSPPTKAAESTDG